MFMNNYLKTATSHNCFKTATSETVNSYNCMEIRFSHHL